MFVKIFVIAGLALLVWSAVARPSGAHGHKLTYRVQAYDTLWTIASAHYGGDVRDAVWQIQSANHLAGTAIRKLTPRRRLVDAAERTRGFPAPPSIPHCWNHHL